MRVLVTGGAGQLGRALASTVDPVSVDLLALDLRASGPGGVRGDVLDPDFVRQAVTGFDAVVHAAALHGVHVPDHSTQRFLRTNVEGTGIVLDACAAAGVGHVVLMSSTSVYGLSARTPFPQTVFVDETTPCRPNDINDLSKVLAEEVARYAARRHGLPTTVLRSGRFFVGDPIAFHLSKLSGAVDVRDVAQAVFRAVAAPPDGCRTYCVASQTRFGRADVPALSVAAAALIEQRYPGATGALARLGQRLPDRLHRVVSIDRARDGIGYQPRENFDRFVERAVAEPPAAELPAAAGESR